jgi:DNA-binding NtrC family response regulator
MSARPHILLVDDNSMITRPLEDFLMSEGYNVTIAYNCEQAADVLKAAARVDLIILDYFMPNGNGTILLASMATEPEMQRPAVIISSSWVEEFMPSWVALRKRLPPVAQDLIKGYVNKPYRFEKMHEAIRCALEHKNGSTPANNEIVSGDFPPEASASQDQPETSQEEAS